MSSLCISGGSVHVSNLQLCRGSWVRIASKACWLAYCKIRPYAVGHPGIFGLLPLTYYIMGHAKSFFGKLNCMGMQNHLNWLLDKFFSGKKETSVPSLVWFLITLTVLPFLTVLLSPSRICILCAITSQGWKLDIFFLQNCTNSWLSKVTVMVFWLNIPAMSFCVQSLCTSCHHSERGFYAGLYLALHGRKLWL